MLSILLRNIDVLRADTSRRRSFDGDMTFVLSQDLAIRIPNHQLVLTQSNITAPNTSAPELLINSNEDTNRTDMPLLGRPFLSSAYLFVDQSQFTIENANPNATEQVLVPGRPGTCFTPTAPAPKCPTQNPACVTGSPRDHQTSDTEDTYETSRTSISQAGMNAAINVPITFVFLAIIVVAYIRSYRKRPTQPAPTQKQRPKASLWPYFKAELSADAQPPHEMPLERNPAYVLAPYEVATKERRGEMRADHESSIRGLQSPSRAYISTRTGLPCRDV